MSEQLPFGVITLRPIFGPGSAALTPARKIASACRGVAEPGSIPGGSSQHQLLIDGNDNIWLFGGYGYSQDSQEHGVRNTLWSFDGTNWRFMGGHNLNNEDISGPKYNIVTSAPHPENVIPGFFNGYGWVGDDGGPLLLSRGEQIFAAPSRYRYVALL